MFSESSAASSGDIFVVGINGSNLTNLTNNSAFDDFGAWSPDSSKIAFVSRRDTTTDEIYVMNADGSGVVRLTNNSAFDSVTDWKRSAAAPRAAYLDYFGTGKSDYLSLDFSGNQIRWDILRNPVTNPPQIRHTFWGLSEADYPMFGDYDGDLKFDVGVWRPGTAANPQSYFYIQLSGNPNPNAIYGQPWGLPDDFPASGDYDGDGKDDFTVVRQENGNLSWYILPSGGGNFRRIVFGLADDFILPIGLDYNNDGREDLVLVRIDEDNNITFYIGDALTGQLILAQQWGSYNVPVASLTFIWANYLGDSRADVGIYYGACPSDPTCEIGGTFCLKETGSSNYTVTKLGIPRNRLNNTGDFPTDGDYDGDGKLDITVFRPQNSTFYSLLSSNGQLKAQYFDGVSTTPPSSANLFESVIKPRRKSVPAGALKGLVITKQTDGTFKAKRAIDFFRSEK